ncbi:MAG TPA: DUF3536 domain-containing protein [Dehalococcoidia bacterium]|nr:DUF3536 domain-containing protein [Dehalococcoidia bacterium]
MERYLCIHGHFYQPPRENPWLEAIEVQDSAYPYHDWNERVTAECYAPNSASRILDEEDRIIQIVNNYSKMSFDVGPTLFAWLQDKAPDVYQALLTADQESTKAYSGHGSALAQPYNHMIMPLANRRDKHTQVFWGIRDFIYRYGRWPEGMWLPETAVDLETLDIMAEQRLRFTILAPHQALRVRRKGDPDWTDVSDGSIDTSMAYELTLPSGGTMYLFFYDDPISRAVAFEGLLSRGENFANRLVSAYSEERSWPQLTHIATDGESYGHHHRFGDMALAYALQYIESRELACLTNYGEYLEKHPPTYEVQITESSSWSCAHGVERWRKDCGCNTGAHPGWNQGWRAPLREALDWLRDTLVSTYEDQGRELFKDPWRARDDYIAVVLERSPENIERFFLQNAEHELRETERIRALKLLELQRHAMLMYTSCGWFFDDLSGIETIQVIQYAGRALQLAQELFGDGLESRFLQLLEGAKSNVPTYGDGRQIYERFVRPAMVNLEKLGAHYAVSSLFEDYPEQVPIYCHRAERDDYHSYVAGRTKLVIGRAQVSCTITGESAFLIFGALHFGDHNLYGGVRTFRGEEAYQALVQEITEPFAKADMAEVIRLLDREFGDSIYSLRSLFRDEQRKILGMVLEPVLADAEADYREIYEDHAPLMHFLADLGVPLPKPLRSAAEMVMNVDLRRAFSVDPDRDRVLSLLEEAKLWGVELDTAGLGFALTKTIEQVAAEFRSQPEELRLLERLEAMASVAQILPFDINLWTVQNTYYEILHGLYPHVKSRAEQGDEPALEWIKHFHPLGKMLRVRIN